MRGPGKGRHNNEMRWLINVNNCFECVAQKKGWKNSKVKLDELLWVKRRKHLKKIILWWFLYNLITYLIFISIPFRQWRHLISMFNHMPINIANKYLLLLILGGWNWDMHGGSYLWAIGYRCEYHCHRKPFWL